MNTSLLTQYTKTVLEFDFKDNVLPSPKYRSLSRAEIQTHVKRTRQLFEKSRATTLVIFGLCSGEYVQALSAELPESTQLVVCESNLTHTRNFLKTHPEWNSGIQCRFILADTSQWAQIHLLAMVGITGKTSYTALNPEQEKDETNNARSLQRLFVAARPHQAINSSYLSHVAVQAPDLSVGVILSPDEPDLEIFFAQFPDWIKEVIVIWDGQTIPERHFHCHAPIRQYAHPLQSFADQRNFMLEKCTGDWVLYLDGDESLSEDTWALFTALMLIKRLEACYFPRMTLYPTEHECKVGFGLWPDLQLRLFRRHANLYFEGSIHEKLLGVSGRVALALDAPILHYSRIRKTDEELSEKLRRFDMTSTEPLKHRLNREYPHLDRKNFAEAIFAAGTLQVLLLENNPA